MKAVGLMVHGGPEVLEVVDLEEVTAGPGQIRIRNFAAAVNPTDIVARDGTRAKLQSQFPPPYVPGMDAAGIVDQVGDGVATGIKVGDRVMAMVVPKASHGAYREQLVLNQHAVVPAPADTTHVQASTLPMNALTARLSLDLLALSPGQVLAVTGGPGAYGGYVIELAKASGLTVIADAVASDRATVGKSGCRCGHCQRRGLCRTHPPTLPRWGRWFGGWCAIEQQSDTCVERRWCFYRYSWALEASPSGTFDLPKPG
jgi:NADPH:quinone reductase-like Zn-dependent oxidoreductase